MNLFKGFEIKSGGTLISHLQYVYYALCIGKTTTQNLWILKALLRGFEILSGLKVSFNKISLIGVNVSTVLMAMACGF